MTYAVLPDGAVDLVIEVRGDSAESLVFGTTTARTDLSLNQHSHYLGIRFRPGQSRHFMMAAAHELTDAYENSDGLLSFSLDHIFEKVERNDLADHLNSLFENHILKNEPSRSRIDGAISAIEANHGDICINEVANVFGKSRRQFERVFLETVGIPAKFFCLITRFHHATKLIHSNNSLADAAINAGYSDQAHMNRDFKRIAGVSPGQLASNVAFLQDSFPS